MKSEKNQAVDTNMHCPHCGAALPDENAFCYQCSHFVDPETERILEYGEVTDDDLRRLVEINDKAWAEYNSKKGTKISFVTMVLVAIIALVGVFVLLFGSMVVGACMVGGAIWGGAIVCQIFSPPNPREWLSETRYQNCIAKYILPGVWPQVFDQVEKYDPYSGIGKDHIKATHLIDDRFTEGKTFDELKAVYRGRSFEFSNVKLSCLMNPMEDEPTRRKFQRVFDGYWISCQTSLRPLYDVIVVDRNPCSGWFCTRINPDDDFDQAFAIKCKDRDYAYSLIDPRSRKILLELRKAVGGRCFVKIGQDGIMEFGADIDNHPLLVKDIHEDPNDVRTRMLRELQGLAAQMDLLAQLE